MYTSYFGFREKPFNLTPDTKFLFLSHHHREALDHLLFGINERKGFVVITGGIGTGKTTLSRALLSHLDPSTKTALIFNSFVTDEDLLKTIIQEFGIHVDREKTSKKDLIDALNSFLLDTFSHGGNAVLLIDEAQNLSQTCLEQIRMLSNLETDKEKLIQIVLMGQCELNELLATSFLKPLNERITVRYDVKPLDRKYIQEYVTHRLVVAGSRGDLRFTKGAIKKLYSYSRGNPRRINAVCDRALLIAYTEEKLVISRTMIKSAIKDSQGRITVDPLFISLSRNRIRAGVVMLFLVVIMVGLAGWNVGKHVPWSIFQEQKTLIAKPIYSAPMPPQPEKDKAGLILDEQTSIAGLFDLFKIQYGKDSLHTNSGHLGFVSLNIDPEFCEMLKKPFRLRLMGPSDSSLPHRRYLLVKKITDDGAMVVDTKGGTRRVSRDFILREWAHEVSWIYRCKDRPADLVEGISSPEVLDVQRILANASYRVEPSGTYDKRTLKAVMEFQRDFGLDADGVIGYKTRALLFQVSG
ncbi:MAG: AAA family ATPase [Desulfatiglans sp.]|nr:AAA family ATPase [Desulfatiglans sp.]